MRDTQVLVVGAGPSGLSVAYHLQGDTLVLEKESEVGGLCRSIERDGGVFDIGGHSFHTPHPEVRELVERLMGDNWETQKRDARVYSHGTLIPYPFQKHFELLPDPRVVEECRAGLSETRSVDGAENFEDYIVRRFGKGVAEHFMLPYNRKIWARDIRRISCEWTSERVAAPKGRDERFDTSGGKRKPLQPDTVIGYPARGGYAEIYKSFVSHLPALLVDQELVRIDPESKVAFTKQGLEVRWERLISTIPLPQLMRLIDGTPRELLDLADQLEFMSLNLLLLLVGRQLPHAPQRIYVADPEIPPHKIAFNHTSSSSLRARPVHAIMAEISYSEERPLLPREKLERKTVQFLVEAGVLNAPEDVAWADHLNVKFAYPVYTHSRPGIIETLKAYLSERGVYTLGRFGEWEYINSDKCIKKGMDLARRLTTTEGAKALAGVRDE